MLEAYAVVKVMISFLLFPPVLNPLIVSFLVKLGLPSLSLSLYRCHQGQCDPDRKRDFVRAKQREKSEWQTGNVSECEWKMSNRKNQRRKWTANLCFKTFPHIVSRAVRWEQGSESWWDFVLYNNHQVCQRFLLIHPIASLPSLSFPSLSLLLSHWCDIPWTVNPSHSFNSDLLEE